MGLTLPLVYWRIRKGIKIIVKLMHLNVTLNVTDGWYTSYIPLSVVVYRGLKPLDCNIQSEISYESCSHFIQIFHIWPPIGPVGHILDCLRLFSWWPKMNRKMPRFVLFGANMVQMEGNLTSLISSRRQVQSYTYIYFMQIHPMTS